MINSPLPLQGRNATPPQWRNPLKRASQTRLCNDPGVLICPRDGINRRFLNTFNAICHEGNILSLRLWDLGTLLLTTAFLLLFLQACSHVAVSSSPRLVSHSPSLEYRIRPGDTMDIKFFYTPELNETVTVRPDGRVSLQLASDIPAAGLTPAELTRSLTQIYSRELKRPEIAVIMRSFTGQRVYVDGEVNKPGIVPLSAGLTVLQSITMAGGLKDSARSNEVILIRQSVKGNPRVFTIDLASVRNGTAHDMTLTRFDVVYVPKSTIANVNVWVNQYIQKNLPISVRL
jgi:polysaccharide export outer membrane protein